MRLYIDPGTGSMLFAIVIGLIGVLIYFLKGLLVKIRFLISGGKKSSMDAKTIPLVIFSDDKRYWPVFLPIVRELDARGFDVVYMTASKDDPVLTCEDYPHLKAQFIGEGNRAFAKLNFLNATIVLSTTPGLDVYQWKRSKYVKYYVHTMHAPEAGLPMYEVFGMDYYDAILLNCVHQEEDIRALEKLRDLPAKELHYVGIPFMDEKLKKVRNMEPVPEHERTILLAPSWGSNSILNRFGSSAIKALLDTGYHIIIRPHPQTFQSETEMIESLMKEFPDSDQLEWNRDTDNYPVLARSDLMISDFSGVIYEFAFLFDKPVICALQDFDKSKYDVWWLDTPAWKLEYIPQMGAILTEDNVKNMKSLIDSVIDDKQYAENRRKIKDDVWLHPEEGAARVADYLLDKYAELTKSDDSEEGSEEKDTKDENKAISSQEVGDKL